MRGAMPFLILALISCVGLILDKKFNKDIGVLLYAIGIGFSLMFLVIGPLCRAEISSEIKQYYVIKQTVKNSAGTIRETALAIKLIDYNAKLADLKYWNNTIFDWFYPDEIDELEYLE